MVRSLAQPQLLWVHLPDRGGLPGSVIKPLLLQYALANNIVQPATEVYCQRRLQIGARHLPCTHPADQNVFTAETALAASCNTWFAQLGARFTTAQLRDAYAAYGLPPLTSASLSVEQRQLHTLGLQGAPVTLQQLTRAYTLFFAQLMTASPVAKGLQGSVRYGMAHGAAVPGLEILGKTGTASDAGTLHSHGWFVGAVPGRVLVAVYVPDGDGGAAALLAQQLFRAYATGRHRP